MPSVKSGTMAKRRSTIVILDDDVVSATLHEIRLSNRYSHHGLRIQTFTSDSAATEFVRANADDVFGYIQDFLRDPMTFISSGDRFYYEVIHALTPWARTAIVTGGGFQSALSWVTRFGMHDLRVAAKAVEETEFYRLADWLLEARESADDDPELSNLIAPDYQILETSWLEVCRYLAEHPKMLHRINPRTFEELVAEIFRTHGWNVELTARTRDHGYDIVAVRQNQPHSTRVLIEAKRFSPERPVGVHVVRALYAVKALNSVSQVILATSSRVSRPAKIEFSRVIPWELDFIERDAILEWCRRYGAVKLADAASGV